MNYEDSDWDDDDYDEDDGDDTMPCPDCGAEIYEDADACPNCGCYLHHGDYAGGSSYPWWTFGGALREWSPFWLFLAMLGVIGVCFGMMMFPF